MNHWELFNLRAQTIGQQTVVNGQRMGAAQLESVVRTALETIEIMKRDLAAREEHRARLNRALGRTEDELHEAREQLRNLRKAYAEVSEANTKLIRREYAWRQLTIEQVDLCEARARLLRLLRSLLGVDETKRLVGAELIEKRLEIQSQLATDAEWQAARDERVRRRLAGLLEEIKRAPDASTQAGN